MVGACRIADLGTEVAHRLEAIRQRQPPLVGKTLEFVHQLFAFAKTTDLEIGVLVSAPLTDRPEPHAETWVLPELPFNDVEELPDSRRVLGSEVHPEVGPKPFFRTSAQRPQIGQDDIEGLPAVAGGPAMVMTGRRTIQRNLELLNSPCEELLGDLGCEQISVGRHVTVEVERSLLSHLPEERSEIL